MEQLIISIKKIIVGILMIGYAMHTTILTLWKQGKSKSEIARITEKDRKTIRKVIQQHKETGSECPAAFHKESSLRQYHTEIISYLESNLSAVRIYEKLQEEQGCTLSYSSIKRYIAKIKVRDQVCVRFHSKPGEEAQVDFGYVGLMFNPIIRRKRKPGYSICA